MTASKIESNCHKRHKSHKTEKEAEIAAQNTFFFTNAVPQRKELNQQVWRSLEDYILKSETVTNGLKVNVFTGPVLHINDPLFISKVKGADVRIPTLFWKIVYFVKSTGELNRVGFIMGQKTLLEKAGVVKVLKQVGAGAAMPDKLFSQFSAAGTYQVDIATIENLTKLSFHKAVDAYKDKRPVKLVLEQVDIMRAGAGRNSRGLNYGIKGLVL